MKSLNILGICLIGTLCCVSMSAQEDEYRPKIAELSYQVLGNYQTISSSETFGDATSKIEQDQLFKFKLGIPVVIKDGTIFGFQFKYYRHHFAFDEDDFSQSYDFYNYLNGQSFTDFGMRVAYQRDLAENKQLSVIAGAELRSDKLVWTPNTAKYFISAQYKKQINERTEIGLGLVYNYGLKLSSVYPLIAYQKVLSPKWTIELLLPKTTSLRYRISQKGYLIVETDFVGWRYNLTNPIMGDEGNFTLRKADLELRLKYERALEDWLWFGIDFGYNKNVSYYLAEPGNRARNALIDLRAKDARYIKFSLFVVPPRKFMK